MPTTIYPTNPSEVAAFAAVLVPVFIWVISGAVRAWNDRKRRHIEEWDRLHQLTKALYNNQLESGLWGQILAVREMYRLGSLGKEAREIASAAAIFFRDMPQTDGTRIIVWELERFAQSKNVVEPQWLVHGRKKLLQAGKGDPIIW